MIKTGVIDPKTTIPADDRPAEKQAATTKAKQIEELDDDPAKRFADRAAQARR